jgi:hypothetical protein
MQGPTQKCKKGRSQGIRREFGDSASANELGLPTPLGLWEDDSVDGWGSSPGHETGSNPGEAAEHVGSNDR